MLLCEIWKESASRLQRRCRLKMLTDGRTDDKRTGGRRIPLYTKSSPMSLRLRWAKNINPWSAELIIHVRWNRGYPCLRHDSSTKFSPIWSPFCLFTCWLKGHFYPQYTSSHMISKYGRHVINRRPLHILKKKKIKRSSVHTVWLSGQKCLHYWILLSILHLKHQ